MQTVGDSRPATSYQDSELVVDLPHERDICARLDELAGIGVSYTVAARSRELDLARLTLHGLPGATAELRSRVDTQATDPAGAPWRVAFPQPVPQASTLDLLLYYVRYRFAEEYAGWIPTMGKNRHVRSVIGLPHLSGGGALYPVKAAPDPLPPAGEPDGTCPVGLLDTRLYPHSDLAGRYTAPDEAMLPASGEYPHWAGHATFIAGLILRAAPAARLQVRSVLDDERAAATAWDLATKMMEFADTGVRVLNLSLGCHTDDGEAPLLIARAVERLTPEILIVAAAGNHGDPALAGDPSVHPRAVTWPAALDSVVAVGAGTATGQRASYSPDTLWVTVLAPGDDLVSTYLRGKVNVHKRDEGVVPDEFDTGYAAWSGSSFAAATVTGYLAKLAAAHDGDPQRALHQLIDQLRAGGHGAASGSIRLPG